MTVTRHMRDTDLRIAVRAEFGESVSFTEPDARGIVVVTQRSVDIDAMVEEIIRLRDIVAAGGREPVNKETFERVCRAISIARFFGLSDEDCARAAFHALGYPDSAGTCDEKGER